VPAAVTIGDWAAQAPTGTACPTALYARSLRGIPKRELYGSKRLGELVARHAALSANALLAAILQDLADFQAGHARSDDLTIMVLQRTS
jgi:hypothetical protein